MLTKCRLSNLRTVLLGFGEKKTTTFLRVAHSKWTVVLNQYNLRMVWPIKFCFKVILENVFWNISFLRSFQKLARGYLDSICFKNLTSVATEQLLTPLRKREKGKENKTRKTDIIQGRKLFNMPGCFFMNIIYQHLSNQNPSHCTLRQFSSRMYTLNLSHQTVWEQH